MIEKLDSFPEIIPFDAAAVKMYCLFEAYGSYDNLANFWKQTDKSGEITALLCISGDTLNLYYNEGDIHEIGQFIRFLGVKNIFTGFAVAEKLGLKQTLSCYFLHAKAKGENTPISLGENMPRNILKILKTGLLIEDDDEFISDLSFRLYKSLAGAYLSKTSAGVVYLCEKASIITALAVLPEFKNKGEGSRALKNLISQCRSEDVFVCCEEINIDFYKKNGFSVIEKVGVWKV